MRYYGVQCIQQQYQNESTTFMDDAAFDKLTEWNATKLRAVNACRLYYGALFPSDLLQYNRKYINRQYIYGNKCMRSEKQHDLWPTQPLPTDD